jgi:tetratricopeptide (TPR) repeat protein
VLAVLILSLTPQTATAADPVEIAARAFELRFAGDLDAAVAVLDEGLAEHPDAAILHHELARARLQLLDIPGMCEEAEAAVACEPANSDYRYFAALAEAYAVIDAAHHQDQKRMKAMGQKALDQLGLIVKTDPGHHEARYRLVQLSMDMAPDMGLEVGDPREHVRRLEEDDPILGAKARCWLVDDAERREIWNRVLAEHPDDCRALAEAAEGFIEIGDLERAEACLERAMARDAESCYGLLRLGLAHAMKQDWEAAIRLTEEYLATDPPVALKAFAVGRLGMIHHRMGDSEQGQELMKEARAIDPHVWQTVMPPPKEIFEPLVL